jgi:hypothetical protein
MPGRGYCVTKLCILIGHTCFVQENAARAKRTFAHLDFWLKNSDLMVKNPPDRLEVIWFYFCRRRLQAMKRMYVGNLPFSSTEADVRALFSRFGDVGTINLIHDRETGRPRGFGFVEMQPEAASKAMVELNGAEFSGRTLKVNEAKPKRPLSSKRE